MNKHQIMSSKSIISNLIIDSHRRSSSIKRTEQINRIKYSSSLTTKPKSNNYSVETTIDQTSKLPTLVTTLPFQDDLPRYIKSRRFEAPNVLKTANAKKIAESFDKMRLKMQVANEFSNQPRLEIPQKYGLYLYKMKQINNPILTEDVCAKHNKLEKLVEMKNNFEGITSKITHRRSSIFKKSVKRSSAVIASKKETQKKVEKLKKTKVIKTLFGKDESVAESIEKAKHTKSKSLMEYQQNLVPF